MGPEVQAALGEVTFRAGLRAAAEAASQLM